MTLRKSMPLFLVMLIVMYALPVASAGVVVNPPAFAQSSSSLAQDIIDSAQQEEADQSSSSAADDNVLDNNNEFGDDDVPVIDQENTADQDAANLGLQDATQEQDVDQDATQEDFDFDVQVGESVQQPPQTEPPPPEEDTTPPTLTVPEDFTVEATSRDGAVVRFEVTAEDNVDGTATLDEENTLTQDDVGGDITISCDPPSGTTFPIGETEVVCTVTDAAGNAATASFTVTVNPAPNESTVITITGAANENQESILIDEEAHDAEICSNFPTVEVSGPGVTSLGQTSSCQGDYGWDISPNPDGLDTTYRVEGNGIEDSVDVNDGRETDRDVYILDANQFTMYDGPGDDRYDLVGVLEDRNGESVGYSDSTGNDRVTFTEEE